MTDQPNRYLTAVLYLYAARRALAERSNVAYVATLKVHQLFPARSATNLPNASVRATVDSYLVVSTGAPPSGTD